MQQPPLHQPLHLKPHAFVNKLVKVSVRVLEEERVRVDEVLGDKEGTWAYELWLYMAMAVWAFDRLLRLGRALKHGVRRAQVTDLGNGYMRVDIRGNHPFSIIPTPSIPKPGLACSSKDEESQKGTTPVVKVESSPEDRPSVGITLFIKLSTGLTKRLRAHGGLLTLLDGPYSNSHAGPVLRCDKVLFIGGGIGITGVVPWAFQHRNVKLVWSVAESARCLTDAIDLTGVADSEVRVGRRFDVDELVNGEAGAGWERAGVVVSGPGSLCDDVRAAVAVAGSRGNTVFEFEVDAYSW
ncbi:uncharacterized protein B0T15DRAFT_558808 [Chaetomium strumarium]|uniref:FAD-binding FR-type domain-containing protein n=1 Tax=Chaetomium strumarium TaxID=1170767 RepID=A0AAJ0GRJ5_9PEZI|nr:hypothetical protein B0T15DRAFT_558808 [Chaetomium strumarium]